MALATKTHCPMGSGCDLTHISQVELKFDVKLNVRSSVDAHNFPRHTKG